MISTKKKIGIYTPCFNEEESIYECYKQVKDVMNLYLNDYDYEHLFIDNSSTDRTIDILKELALNDSKVKIIVNSKNYGLERSPYHGLMQVEGDVLILILADLQTPPEVMPKLIKMWEAGNEIVLASYRNSEKSWLLNHARKLFYRINKYILDVETIENFMGFGAYDRKIVDLLREIKEPDPFFRGLIAELGFKKAFVEYRKPPRRHGKSKHSFFDLYKVLISGVTKYSILPLQIMTLIGFVAASISFVSGCLYLVLKLIYWDKFPLGFAPIIISILFFSSVQLICLGIIGEYIAAILKYVRDYPLVIEKERVNFDK